jgi:ABC-type antimicrobial peptide transport system, ATPase component
MMAAALKPIITMRNITKIYNVGGEEVRALDGASLTINEGEFVSLIGPSGSGKSTMMNIIGCLDVADEGEYLLDGQSIEQYSEEELARIRNKKIGFVFQSFNLLSRMTAWENVELPLIYQQLSVGVRKEKTNAALERVGLIDRGNHKPTELSGGQQQRVAIARALATEPAILLADEPTGNLDSKTGNDIVSLFHELHAAGNTIVLITHSEEIAHQAQRRIRIIDGRVSEVE